MMKVTSFKGLCLILLISLILPVIGVSASGLPVKTIGIVMDGPDNRYPHGALLFKQEIISMLDLDFQAVFPDEFELEGNWTKKSVNVEIDRLLAEPAVDLIITLGYLGSHAVSQRTDLSKPVIAPLIIDREFQELPFRNNTSGVKNLCYIDSYRSITTNIRVFENIAKIQNVTLFLDTVFVNEIPEIKSHIDDIAKDMGISVTSVPVQTSGDLSDQIPEDTDAVIFAPLFQIPQEEFVKLVNIINEQQIPSFSMTGKTDVELGVLASNEPVSYIDHLARSTAINVLDIFSGEKPEDLNVTFPTIKQLTINMETARLINQYPSWQILTEANLINLDQSDRGRVVSLYQVIQEALTANLDLNSNRRGVAAGEERVKESRGALLPQVSLGSAVKVIDADHAEYSGGLNPEREWTGSARLYQQLYSDKAWTSYSVEKQFQVARTEALNSQELDIILQSSRVYLNMLRLKTLEKIQMTNLKLTRANLERARTREAIGAAGPDEVYRWDSEISKARQQVLESVANTLDAEAALNKILNKPISEKLSPLDEEMEDPLAFLVDERIFTYIDNPKSLRLYRDYIVLIGEELSPELKSLDAQIQAQERLYSASKRDFWVPTFSLQGNVTERFAEDGAGSGSDIGNHSKWGAGVFLDFPLFKGGSKPASYRRTIEELEQLKLQRDSLSESIEQRVTREVNDMVSSYPGIRLSRDAAEAASKNLELVTSSYSRGVKSIIDLLDAQNLAVIAEEQVTDSKYDFIIDLLDVHRSAGSFDPVLIGEETDSWYRNLEAYFKEHN